jgi:hypothetical protein
MRTSLAAGLISSIVATFPNDLRERTELRLDELLDRARLSRELFLFFLPRLSLWLLFLLWSLRCEDLERRLERDRRRCFDERRLRLEPSLLRLFFSDFFDLPFEWERLRRLCEVDRLLRR